MFEDDNEENYQNNIDQTIAKYEDMIVRKQPAFFDIHDLEDLIEYYELRLDTAKAIEVVDYALDVYPFSAALLTKKASFLMQKRKHKEALELLDKAETLEPKDLGVYLLRADIYLSKSEHNKSIEIIDAAMKFAEFNEMEELWLEKADVYEDIGAYDKVYECLKKCLMYNASNVEALSRMWYSVELANAFEDSVQFHKQLIDEMPYSYFAWHNLGSAYYFLGLYERSIEAYEYALAINENYDLAYRECGDAYFKLKQYHKAIDNYKKAIEISKPYEELHYAIGLCYEKLKDYPKARLHYRKAINSDPKFHQAFYRIGLTYKRDKQWENAALFYHKALQLDHDKLSYILAIAEAASKLGDQQMLQEMIIHLQGLNPQLRSKKTYKQLTTHAIQTSCYELALDIIGMARIENKVFDDMAYYEAVATYLAGMHKEAISLFEVAIRLNFNNFKMVPKFIPGITRDNSVIQLLDTYQQDQ